MLRRYLLRVVAPVALLVLTAVTVGATPVQWAANGHSYDVIVVPQGLTWDSARTAAQLLGPGWDLATITSAEEQAFIQANFTLGLASNTGVVEYWLGGYQTPPPEPAGNWNWINGEGTFWNNGPVPGMYANWGGGEPNNSGGENHLAIDNRYGWGWNDNDPYIGGYVYGYVAENPVPEPGSMILLGTGLLGAVRAYRKRRS